MRIEMVAMIVFIDRGQSRSDIRWLQQRSKAGNVGEILPDQLIRQTSLAKLEVRVFRILSAASGA